ncbi:MAG TPA: flagellar assembly protein FliW [Candidatus Acidoferrales bacterium]|nr:flagellar assembly protein FliW [Candidatus Acidoferrales bacterium]
MESRTPAIAVRANLPRFGEIAYTQTDVIEFPWGMPGFAACTRWLVLALESQPNFVWLQSLDDVRVALPAASPRSLFDWYQPELPASAFVALGITAAGDFTTLCVVVVGKDAAEMSMNLAAPILINVRARKALQITLPGGEYSAREKLPRTYDCAGAALAAKAS